MSSNDPAPMTEAELDHTMEVVDGVNGSAGHHLDDPHLRTLLRRSIAGELTGEEYRAQVMAHLSGANPANPAGAPTQDGSDGPDGQSG